MSSKEKCRQRSCVKMLPAGQYACSYHWFALPAKVRQAIVEHRPASKKEAPSEAYLKAIAEADSFLNGKSNSTGSETQGEANA